MKLIIFSLFIVLNFVHFSSACRCLDLTFENAFCKRDFLIQATVLGAFSNDIDTVYRIKVLAVLKKNEKVKSITQIYTGNHSCKAFLEIGKTYIIGGSWNDKKSRASIITCDYIFSISDQNCPKNV